MTKEIDLRVPSSAAHGGESPQVGKGYLHDFLDDQRLKIVLLNALSYLAIYFFSGSFAALLFLGMYTCLSYFYIKLLSAVTHLRSRATLFHSFLILHVAVFLYLQASGYIGILNTENATSPKTFAVLIGFAFYILQVLAIAGAVYRRLIPPLDLSSYTLAISFCGAFLAGPIFNQEQLKKFRNLQLSYPSIRGLHDNLHLLIGALLFKFVFANWLVQWVNLLEVKSPLGIAKSILSFELQVYFDFAGYSLISLFLCRLLNIPMYYNFQHPFAAKDIPDFWRRWHVGLGAWFKENVFIPLKEMVPRKWATKAAIPLIVFAASAMWHGPTRNFLLWGLFHGLAFILSVNLISKISQLKVGRIFSKIYLLLVIFYGRLLFMDSDFPRLLEKFRVMGKFRLLGAEILAIVPNSRAAWEAVFITHWDDIVIAILIFAAIAYELFFPIKQDAEPYRYFRPGIASILLLVIVLLCLQPLHRAGFVYGR